MVLGHRYSGQANRQKDGSVELSGPVEDMIVQVHHWGVAAYFGRLRLFTHDGEDENLTAVMEKPRGDLTVPDPEGKPGEDGKAPKKTIVPRLPGGEAGPVSPKRRQALAEWITADSNPYFARNAANQV